MKRHFGILIFLIVMGIAQTSQAFTLKLSSINYSWGSDYVWYGVPFLPHNVPFQSFGASFSLVRAQSGEAIVSFSPYYGTGENYEEVGISVQSSIKFGDNARVNLTFFPFTWKFSSQSRDIGYVFGPEILIQEVNKVYLKTGLLVGLCDGRSEWNGWVGYLGLGTELLGITVEGEVIANFHFFSSVSGRAGDIKLSKKFRFWKHPDDDEKGGFLTLFIQKFWIDKKINPDDEIVGGLSVEYNF